MKKIIITLPLLAAFVTAGAQAFEIDTFMFKEGYYDDILEAAKNPGGVLYLNLAMQHPKWKEVPSQAFGFKNLIRLDMTFNQVASVADGIGELTNLEWFNLEGNHYLTKVSMEIGKCKKLKYLNLKNAKIPAEDIQRIREMLPECDVVTQ